jgi:hypothetical protein
MIDFGGMLDGGLGKFGDRRINHLITDERSSVIR